MATMDHSHPRSAATATDPVCGMTVKTADARNKAAHEGHTYYFCSARCLAKFTAEPLRYLKPAAAPAVPAAKPGTIYTCPMHPEIRQVGPGSCPICGMALEPAEASLEDGPNEELLDMTRRLWIGAALAVPILALDMGGHLFGIDALLPHGMQELAAAGARDAGRAVGRLAVLRARRAVGGAALAQHVHPDRARHRRRLALQRGGDGGARPLPAALHGADGTMAVYFESAPIIIVLVLVGQVLELRARDATGGAIKALLGPGAAHGDAGGRRRPGRRSGDRRRSPWAIGCACGRARRCRSTVR